MPPTQTITDLPVLPQRARDSHKGTFGHVLVVAGSRGMSGAAVLCGSAALRGGAGTVQIAAPEEIQPIVAAGQPCCTTAGLPATEEGHFAAHALPQLMQLVERADALAIGPGLGASVAAAWLVRELLAQTILPVVVDADGLGGLLPLPENQSIRKAPTILTPHPGEFGRLVGKTAAEVQANRESLAAEFARKFTVVLVLKGAGTVVTDGTRMYVNRTGNPGMATGGSGDVLTGLIAALLGQRLEALAAAQLGVYLHGLAGDLARDALGEESLIAVDLLHYLPAAFKAYRPRAIREA